VPGKLIGTAPAASYWLLRPEDVGSEYIIEEYNWVSAAEFADSVGADIINSSLGYTRFDDTTQSHTCADMDGKTTPVTRGANMAVSRGMLVVNSAGNSGGSSWQCVGAPADGISVLAIAAVDSNKVLAGFSSRGVSTTRIKPNVAAMGVMTVLSAPDGTIGRSNGTSFSSPVVAGMVACLWEALPDWSNSNIFRAIELSSSQASHPDSLLGFGIPDFYKAMINISLNEYISSNRLTIFPNPVNDRFTMSHDGSLAGHTVVYILDQMGRVVFTHEFTAGAGEKHHSLKLPDGLSGGCYLIRVVNNENTYVSKMVKR
jgi:subtilisin family serine protease